MEEEQPKELKLMDFKGEAENFNYKPISVKATAWKDREQLVKGQPDTELVDTAVLMSASES